MPKLHFSYKTLIWINNEHNCNLKQLYINVHFFMNKFYLQWAAYVCLMGKWWVAVYRKITYKGENANVVIALQLPDQPGYESLL